MFERVNQFIKADDNAKQHVLAPIRPADSMPAAKPADPKRAASDDDLYFANALSNEAILEQQEPSAQRLGEIRASLAKKPNQWPAVITATGSSH